MNNLAFYLARIYYNLIGQSVNPIPYGFTDSYYAEKIYRHIAGLPSGLSGGKNVSFWLELWFYYRTGQSYRLAIGDRPAWFWLSKLYAAYTGGNTQGILQPASAEFWAEKLLNILPAEISVTVNSITQADNSTFVPSNPQLSDVVQYTVRATNNGTANLTIQNATRSGAVTAVTAWSSNVLIPGASAICTITLDTSNAGTQTGYFEFINNDPDDNESVYRVNVSYEVYIFEDTFNRADGALANGWTNNTWTIASNKAINVPTLGAELLTDPGLEANYTAGKCDTLSKTGLPVLAQSADSHGGTKAQQFTAVANGNLVKWPVVIPTKHKWYSFKVWGKRTAGTSLTGVIYISQTGGLPFNTPASSFGSGTYTQEVVSLLATSTNTLDLPALAEQGSSGFSTYISDDGSLKAITDGDVYALRDVSQANVAVKVMPPGVWSSFADSTYFGVVVRADALANPSNYIVAFLKRRQNSSTQGTISLFKRVGETYTLLISNMVVTLANNAYLEIRANGSTVSLWYNNIQVGTNQTVSDGAILNNTIHGLASAGSNTVDDFIIRKLV